MWSRGGRESAALAVVVVMMMAMMEMDGWMDVSKLLL